MVSGSKYITKYRIFTFMEVELFEHRGFFIDINLTQYLHNNFLDSKHLSNRMMDISIPSNIRKYKELFKHQMNHGNIPEKIKE